MVQRVVILGVLALFCTGMIRGGKVLVMPMDGSHWLSMKILIEELSQRGHNVVVLAPEHNFLIRRSTFYTTQTYKVPFTMADLEAQMDTLKKGLIKAPRFTAVLENFQRLITYSNMQVKGCELLLYDEALMEILKEHDFDIMLIDPFLPCGPIVAEALSLPVVYFLRATICGVDISAAQGPSPPSYVPRLFTGNTDVMNFPQRVKNVLMWVAEIFLCRLMYGNVDELASRYLQKSVTYESILAKGTVWLQLYDYTLEYPKPQMPNMVQIGGINYAKMKPLPAVSYVKDLTYAYILNDADQCFLTPEFTCGPNLGLTHSEIFIQ